jgi:hypothetical protein
VKLCREGIEQVQGVHRRQKNSIVSSRRTRITKDSESSSRRALSRCIRCTGEDITVGRSVGRHSTRRALSRCWRAQRELSFEF